MIKALKFFSGFVSNALTQTARCLWNLAACMSSLAFSLLCAFMAMLQFAGGGRKQSNKTLLLMASALKMSLKCGLIGVLQGLGVLTFSSPLMRAAQACSEEISPKGILLPCGSDRNLAQRILGLNSWEEQKSDKKAPTQPKIRLAPIPAKEKVHASAEKTMTETLVIKVETKPAVKANVETQTTAKRPKHPTKTKPARKCAEAAAWELLVKQYLEARTIKEMNRIRNEMALKYTRNYLNALKAASKSRSKKKAA